MRDILIGIVPRHRRGLVFSVKQAGVPLGGRIAGLMLPAALLWGGIGAALSATAGMAFAAAFVLGYWFREPGPLRHVNLSAILTPAMLARPVAMFRLGISRELADLLGGLSLQQIVKLSASSLVLCRFRFDDHPMLTALTQDGKNLQLQQAHTAILLAGQPVAMAH